MNFLEIKIKETVSKLTIIIFDLMSDKRWKIQLGAQVLHRVEVEHKGVLAGPASG